MLIVIEKKKNKNNIQKISLGKSQLEFNYFISYSINIEPEFECKYKYLIPQSSLFIFSIN